MKIFRLPRMMNAITFTLIAFVFSLPLFGQSTEGWTAPALQDWFTQFDAFYVGATVVFGYLSGIIPGLNKIRPLWRVLAWAILTALGLWHFKDVSILKLAMDYFFATSLYEVVLKGLFSIKSPPAKP